MQIYRHALQSFLVNCYVILLFRYKNKILSIPKKINIEKKRLPVFYITETTAYSLL